MSRERARGTAAETAVVHYLRPTFPYVERRSARGRLDAGDIAGIVGVVIEVKAHARMELAAWLDEAARETANGRADYGAVWHKRRGRGSPGDWFVTLDGETFTRLLKAALAN